MPISAPEIFRTFPIVGGVIPIVAAIKCSRPRKPIAVHLHSESDDHWMGEFSRAIGPLVDVGVPFSSDDIVETKFVRTTILHVRFVPRRPKNERQRPMSPD